MLAHPKPGAKPRNFDPIAADLRCVDSVSLEAFVEIAKWDFADLQRNPKLWRYPVESLAFISQQLDAGENELRRRRHLQNHPLAPRPINRRAELDEIKSRIDLVAFFESTAFVVFERRGQRVWARCPLPDHKEDLTPSFCIEPNQQLWFCHGCTRGGDVVRFAECLYPEMTFPAIVDLLARSAGVDRPLRRTRGALLCAGPRTVRVG